MSLALILFLFCFRFAASTAMHSLELGFRTILVDDCSRGIDGDDIKKTFEKVRESNGLVVQSNEVPLFFTSFKKIDASCYLPLNI